MESMFNIDVKGYLGNNLGAHVLLVVLTGAICEEYEMCWAQPEKLQQQKPVYPCHWLHFIFLHFSAGILTAIRVISKWSSDDNQC